MAVDAGIAVARKMFGGNQHHVLGIGVRAVDVGGHVLRDFLRILAVRADVDHRILRIVVDVGNRREDPLDAQRARFARGRQALMRAKPPHRAPRRKPC